MPHAEYVVAPIGADRAGEDAASPCCVAAVQHGQRRKRDGAIRDEGRRGRLLSDRLPQQGQRFLVASLNGRDDPQCGIALCGG